MSYGWTIWETVGTRWNKRFLTQRNYLCRHNHPPRCSKSFRERWPKSVVIVNSAGHFLGAWLGFVKTLHQKNRRWRSFWNQHVRAVEAKNRQKGLSGNRKQTTWPEPRAMPTRMIKMTVQLMTNEFTAPCKEPWTHKTNIQKIHRWCFFKKKLWWKFKQQKSLWILKSRCFYEFLFQSTPRFFQSTPLFLFDETSHLLVEEAIVQQGHWGHHFVQILAGQSPFLVRLRRWWKR